jgi:hypothetical protein
MVIEKKKEQNLSPFYCIPVCSGMYGVWSDYLKLCPGEWDLGDPLLFTMCVRDHCGF